MYDTGGQACPTKWHTFARGMFFVRCTRDRYIPAGGNEATKREEIKCL